MLWEVLHCVTVSNFRSFFWVSKVIDTLSAWLRTEACAMWCRAFPSLKKAMFPTVSCLVRLSDGFETFRYSHDLHAKKKAPMMSWEIACFVSDV